MDSISSDSPQDKFIFKQLKRFWQRVDTSGDCWLWTGFVNSKGYGVFALTSAHRFAWKIANGDIPEGLYICHRCNNPICVNPDHLYAGTQQQNMDDKVAAGHHLSMPNGESTITSKLTEKQVREIRGKYALGCSTLRSLAKEYGVSHETIRLVISAQTWRHV